jgi:hypothetical protein
LALAIDDRGSGMRAAKRWVPAGVFLGVAVLASAALAASTVKVTRCGYGQSRPWGHVAIYPWRMSCGAARETLTASNARHLPTIEFTADGAATFDGGALKIDGQWWVCGGRMGFYFCGYPYRPARAPGVGGGTTFKGPFTEEFMYQACKDNSYACWRRTQLYQPPRSYR